MKETEIQKEKPARTVRGEPCTHGRSCHQQSWCCTVLHSGAGIFGNIKRAVCIFRSFHTRISLGTWTYIFQGLLVLSLMDPAEKICAAVSVQFCSGICIQRIIGCAWELDQCFAADSRDISVIYFLISYILLCIGIALSNRCKLPIIPTDLFPRELSDITSVTYSKIKVGFDVTCLAVTAGLTFAFLRTSWRPWDRNQF